MTAPPTPTGRLRTALAAAALVVLAAAGWRLADRYLSNPNVPRPHDFLQVWGAGRLLLAGENPYDGAAMYRLQTANRMPDTRSAAFPDGYASMMWVPPWGLILGGAIATLPINLAQMVWGFGQLALITASAVVVWRVYGGSPQRQWVAVVLTLGSGPVWWQTTGGQYAGLVFAGVAGFLAAHRRDRPFLAGIALTLVALKPHLFIPLAIGLLIDAVRTRFGRRVVLGGAVGLAAAAAVVTVISPAVWGWYAAAAAGGGPGGEWYPKLSAWFNPTAGAWARHALSGRPFWVQFLPAAVTAVAFAAYWWREGDPGRWPVALVWVLPLGLVTAPYGSWASDLTLLLVPAVWVAVRLNAAGWPARAWPAVAGYVAANAAVVAMTAYQSPLEDYVWVAPVVCACLLAADRAAARRSELRPLPAHPPAGVDA